MEKRTDTGSILALVLLSVLIAGCARIQELRDVSFSRDPSRQLYYELSTAAAAERIGKEEFILRFPDTALFRVGEYSLIAGSKQNIRKVARLLCEHPEFTVIVEGHADSKGRKSYNQWLSERRSRVVADFLVNEGLDPDRIQVVGYGELRPIATNATPEGRQQNRRVEIHLKTEKPLPEDGPVLTQSELPHS